MSDTMIECPEIIGKTVRCLKLVTAESGSQEVHIDFTDGTAFSLTVEASTRRSARLISQSESGTDTIRNYDD